MPPTMYSDLDQAFAGMLYGFDHDRESPIAQETIEWGSPVFGYQGFEDKAWAAHQDYASGVFSGALIASNSTAVTIIADGDTITIDPVVYSTSSPVTIGLIIDAINANASCIAKGIVASLGGTALTILLKAKGVNITSFTAVVTAGSSQATFSATYSTWAKFLGVAQGIQTAGKNSSGGFFGSGTAKYYLNDPVSCVRRGRVWVPVSVAVEDKQAAYAIFAASNNNKFTSSSSGTYDTGTYFRSNRNSQNLAVLEVRGMK